MADNVFRTPVDKIEQQENIPSGKTDPVVASVEVEVPYSQYKNPNEHSLFVDEYNLGDVWEDRQGGFPDEVKTINKYIQNKIYAGELADSIKSVKEEYKKIEKITQMDKEERNVVKIPIMAAYARFLMEADKVKLDSRRYAY